MDFKYAIFDADGTIFDSMQYWKCVASRYIISLKKAPKPDLDKTVQNMSLKESALFLKSEYDISDDAETIMASIDKSIEKYYEKEAETKSGVLEFIKDLKKRNIGMSIASATDEYLLDMALKRCGLGDCFDKIYTCSSIGFGKDRPFIFRAAVNDYNISKNECLVFDDALYAIKTAKNDGFITIGIFDSIQSDAEAIKNACDYYLDNFENLDGFWNFVKGR